MHSKDLFNHFYWRIPKRQREKNLPRRQSLFLVPMGHFPMAECVKKLGHALCLSLTPIYAKPNAPASDVQASACVLAKPPELRSAGKSDLPVWMNHGQLIKIYNSLLIGGYKLLNFGQQV